MQNSSLFFYRIINPMVYLVCAYVCMVIIHSKCKDQPGKVANHARGQLNRENGYVKNVL